MTLLSTIAGRDPIIDQPHVHKLLTTRHLSLALPSPPYSPPTPTETEKHEPRKTTQLPKQPVRAHSSHAHIVDSEVNRKTRQNQMGSNHRPGKYE